MLRSLVNTIELKPSRNFFFCLFIYNHEPCPKKKPLELSAGGMAPLLLSYQLEFSAGVSSFYFLLFQYLNHTKTQGIYLHHYPSYQYTKTSLEPSNYTHTSYSLASEPTYHILLFTLLHNNQSQTTDHNTTQNIVSNPVTTRTPFDNYYFNLTFDNYYFNLTYDLFYLSNHSIGM